MDTSSHIVSGVSPSSSSSQNRFPACTTFHRLASLFGFPETCGGIFTSGEAIATLVSLAVARQVMGQRCGWNVREEGMFPFLPRVYTSAQARPGIERAVELLGIGRTFIHIIPSTSTAQMDLEVLVDAVVEDSKKGRQPLCVVGMATRNKSMQDDIKVLADFCQRRRLWLHIYGASEACAGYTQADSLVLEVPRWVGAPENTYCALIREPEYLHQTYSVETMKPPASAADGSWLWV